MDLVNKSKTTFLANKSNKPLINHISELFDKSNKIDIAVAFLSLGGWNLLKPLLLKWLKKNSRELRLLVRKDDRFPDKNAVDEITKIGNIEFKYYEGTEFHAKQWIFYTNDIVYVLIGSANLTRSGLIKNAEANILTELKLNNPELRKIENNFQKWWENSEYFPVYKHWKGVTMAIQGQEMSFNLKDLSLEDLMWLKNHKEENPDIYNATFSGRTTGSIMDMKFDIRVTTKKWSENTMTVLNEIINRFKTEE